jgi:alanine-glyoxylate transaminase/serine-glyoxylate transaminase/serine-pyruvate transaminase
MGHLSAHSLMGTLGCIGAGLKAIGVPHGAGGLDAAAAVIAGTGTGAALTSNGRRARDELSASR